MVGTAAVLMTSVDDMRNCKDRNGVTTGIPDIPVVSAPLVQQCSDQSFPMVPPTVHCDTRDQHPQRFDANVARGYYFTKKYGDLHGIYIFASGPKTIHDGEFAGGLGGLRDLAGAGRGVRSDADFALSPDAQQSQFTP